jgi:ATP-dependent Clp protease protease subunit
MHPIPLPRNRTLYLAKQVDQDSMNMLSKEILEINSSDIFLSKISEIYDMKYNPKPIVIYIDSYGGAVYQCLGLLEIMKKSRVPVHTIVTGCAMSCGFLIAITGDKRFAYDKSTFMYHQVSYGAIGKAKEIEEEVIEGKRLQKLIEQHTLTNTNLSKKQLKENYAAKKDWYFDSKEALKYSIIDELV